MPPLACGCPPDPYLRGCYEHDDAGWMPLLGNRHYQVKVFLPGGRLIVCGASGYRRDWVAADWARLLRLDVKHVQVSRRLPRPADRRGRDGRPEARS